MGIYSLDTETRRHRDLFSFVMLNVALPRQTGELRGGMKHLPVRERDSSLRSDYTLMKLSKVVLSVANDNTWRSPLSSVPPCLCVHKISPLNYHLMSRLIPLNENAFMFKCKHSSLWTKSTSL